ncbi:MAG: glycosyltransferase family 4 protein [Bryobacteraceae bacterium]
MFLSPEPPRMGAGGGALRSASLLEYLRRRYRVKVVNLEVPLHSKSTAARAWRNGWRLMRGVPPLFDRFSGFEDQLEPALRNRRYAIGVVEHFWCASYARALRPHCGRLVLDLHNIESELARSHALAASGPRRFALNRFARAYTTLEQQWIPEFDLVLTASDNDRRRVSHPNVRVFPNALPEIALPHESEQDCIVFSGNLEYHPNIEAVRWFDSQIWPRLREEFPNLQWWLVGRNHEAAKKIAGGDGVRFTGPVEDAIAELARAKVCVVPLRSGSGTRFKILEAWAAGRAVVSTTIGAEGLGAISGEHLLVADTVDDFAAAIFGLLENVDLRRKLGESGRALYLERYTWPSAWRALESAGL